MVARHGPSRSSKNARWQPLKWKTIRDREKNENIERLWSKNQQIQNRVEIVGTCRKNDSRVCQSKIFGKRRERDQWKT